LPSKRERYLAKKVTISKKAKTASPSENLAENILNCSRSMLSIINRDYVYEKVNSTFCSAHKISNEGMAGRSLPEVWGETTFVEKIKNNIDSCFRGNTIRYEANFDTPCFGNRYYEVIFRPIIRENGKITRLLAETFDITDLKLSKQVLNEMEEEFRKIETNLPIGFLRCEPDGTIIQANKAFLKIMECDDESLVTGLNIREFYAEKGLFDIHLRQLFHEQKKTFGRVPLYTCMKTEIACRISGFIVTGETSTPPFIDFAFEDSSRELMLENRLLQAQKLETIGALAGGLAHDFNNILATIFGYSELLLDEFSGNTSAAEKISRIISAAAKAKSLTSQILTFSRQVEQQKIPVSIYEVLMETIGFVESGKPANINLTSNVIATDAMVYADPTQLFRVFLNLMTNAIQAMETSGGTLSIAMSVVQGNHVRHELSRNIVADEYAIVVFEDTGMGMEASVVQRIFEPYFTTREGGRGTGMGLSVVHGIVSEIEGEILVSSKPDKGTVFSLYMPISHDYPSVPENSQEKRLLFITGNRYESRILSLALEKSGYKLVFASDRNSIRKVISDDSQKPDMVIYMDDSEEVSADDIRELFTEHNIRIPLILITDNDQYITKEKLLNSGVAKQVLIKPVSLKEIHNAIQISLV
jgi:signal transduction histidine kinase/CheY-like chemotaxis protein